MPQTVPDFESELYRLEELVLSMDGCNAHDLNQRSMEAKCLLIQLCLRADCPPWLTYGIFTILPRERRCRMLNITGEGCGAFFRSSKKLYEHVHLCHLPDNLHERRPHLLHLTLLPSIGRFSLHRTDFQGFVRSLKERLKVQMLIAKGQEIQVWNPGKVSYFKLITEAAILGRRR